MVLSSWQTRAAEAIEVSREDELERGLREAELREAGHSRRHDIVVPEKLHLIPGERRRAGEPFEKARLEHGQAPGKGDEQAFAANLMEKDLHERLEAIDAGAAQFEDLARGIRSLECRHHRLRDIGDIDRLEAGGAAADQRQGRKKRGEPGEAIEELILGP